jgi:hypothetical protein
MLTARCRTVNAGLVLSLYGCLPTFVFVEFCVGRGLVTVHPHKKFYCLAEDERKFHSEGQSSKKNQRYRTQTVLSSHRGEKKFDTNKLL